MLKPHRFSALEQLCRQKGYQLIAGLDEAGRGPWAGPLVCAAVILKPRVHLPKLNDSKLLTPLTREFLAKKIKAECHYGIGVVSPQAIDRLGLIRACEKAFILAVRKLTVIPDYLLVDGNDYFKFPYPFQSIIRGDRRVRSIAAASIIAKVHRDALMKKLAIKFSKYAFEKHKGYGTRLHRKLLEEFGPCKIHRLSYKPLNVSGKVDKVVW